MSEYNDIPSVDTSGDTPYSDDTLSGNSVDTLSYNNEKPEEVVSKIKYTSLSFSNLEQMRKYYLLRAFKACDSCQLEQYLYRYFFSINACTFDDALLMSFSHDSHRHYGILPFCSEEKLPWYFKLQETYFNKVLGLPHIVSLADEEGLNVLKEAEVLESYLVTEAEDAKDYIYSAESLRTLSGRKYSKKRNHINKFLAEYEGRWKYRKLTCTDHDDIMNFLDAWMKAKLDLGPEAGVNEFNEKFDAESELAAEYHGIKDLVGEDVFFSCFRIGGIFIDDKLEAFSIGDYNKLEKMGLVSVEKANENISGLYQMINQQFAINEFPDAEIINREDDIGMEGLRQSKLSYYPIGYARKFTLTQKDFSEDSSFLIR